MGIYGEYFIFYLSSFGKKNEIKQYYLLLLLKHDLHLFTFDDKNINFSKVKYTTSVFSYRQSNNKI